MNTIGQKNLKETNYVSKAANPFTNKSTKMVVDIIIDSTRVVLDKDPSRGNPSRGDNGGGDNGGGDNGGGDNGGGDNYE